MTVKELIDNLKEFPSDFEVCGCFKYNKREEDIYDINFIDFAFSNDTKNSVVGIYFDEYNKIYSDYINNFDNNF